MVTRLTEGWMTTAVTGASLSQSLAGFQGFPGTFLITYTLLDRNLYWLQYV